jgi:phage-related protein
MQPTSSWGVVFYRDVNGRVPVDEWIHTLPAQESGRVLKSIGLLASYGVRLGMPHTRHLRGKVWELRIAAGRKHYRVLYAPLAAHKFILLHAFAKKTDKTPSQDLAMAERRLADHDLRSGGVREP